VNAEEIVGLLADGDRRRVVAAMILGADTAPDIARSAGLDVRAVASALHRLAERGLVIRDGEHAYVVEEAFALAARAAAEALRSGAGAGVVGPGGARDEPDARATREESESLRSSAGAGVVGPGGARDEPDARATREEKVMRSFVRDGRITQIPMQHTKRRILLDWLVQDFEPGRRYSEPMVNLILGKRHPDTAALRRALVDEELMDRDHGEYWRIGGPVDTAAR